jgi:phage tail sheath protein FI
MAALLQTPGVYIREETGPGVIQQVGTSTAVFLGPAAAGPINQPTFLTSFDDYVRNFGIPQPSGQPLLYIPTTVAKRRYFLTDAVRGFFQNGGTEAYVLRVSNAQQATWSVVNSAVNPETEFRIQAVEQGPDANSMVVAVSASSLVSQVNLASGTATVKSIDASHTLITVDSAAAFVPGDTLTVDQTQLAVVAAIDATNTVITLQAPLAGLNTGDTLTLADITPSTGSVRLKNPADAANLFPGSVLYIQGNNPSGTAVSDYAVVQSKIKATGVLLLTGSPLRTNTFRPGATPTTLTSQEFTLTVTPPGGGANVTAANLSLERNHPNWVLGTSPTNPMRALSGLAVPLPPPVPPTSDYPAKLVNAQTQSPIPSTQIVLGSVDVPDALGLADYSAALNLLLDVEDVNIVCIPDAASHPTDSIEIQQAMINHCLDPSTRDRVAILDSQPGVPPGPGIPSVTDQRNQVQSENGFAALYYPWLALPDLSPTADDTRRINVPPCGHIAGIYAQVDAAVGPHKAPANVQVAGVVSLERILSDRQQGPLNIAGINVLRIFPGSGAVTVWGARTTVDPAITDWVQMSTRRSLISIEQSIKQALMSSVFLPNNPSLWGALTREIEEFLTRVWQTGALFGTKAADAFYVRIDAGNNPPSLQAQGQLNIEIGVRPSYAVEFIIATISLWDGGAQVTEH